MGGARGRNVEESDFKRIQIEPIIISQPQRPPEDCNDNNKVSLMIGYPIYTPSLLFPSTWRLRLIISILQYHS